MTALPKPAFSAVGNLQMGASPIDERRLTAEATVPTYRAPTEEKLRQEDEGGYLGACEGLSERSLDGDSASSHWTQERSAQPATAGQSPIVASGQRDDQLSDACCGARCFHCDEWRKIEQVQPPHGWCKACRATVYLVRGKCAGCGGEVTR